MRLTMLVLMLIYLLLVAGCSSGTAPARIEPSDISASEKLHAKMEVAVSGLPTSLRVGEIVTLTVVVTNTGVFRLDKMYCQPDVYQENKPRQYISSSQILQQVYLSTTYPDYGEAGKDFKITRSRGQSNQGVIVLRAIGEGRERIGIGCGALEQVPQSSEHWTSGDYQPVLIRVYPTTAVMTADQIVIVMRTTWLILCGMMLLSRFAFQAAGPVRMRAFLDGWKVSKTHRGWGIVAFLWGAFILVSGIGLLTDFEPVEIGLGVMLIGVLMGDGLLNSLPSSFSRFKEEMQNAWVRRQPGNTHNTDRALFGTVNFFLGLASVAMAAVVIGYKPITVMVIGVALGIAVLATALLIGASLLERRHHGLDHTQ